MKQFKDFNACVSKLLEMQRGNDLTAEQKKGIANALEEFRRLRRINNPTRAQFERSMRKIVDAITGAMMR